MGNGRGAAWDHGMSSRVGVGGRCGTTATVDLQGAAIVPGLGRRWPPSVSNGKARERAPGSPLSLPAGPMLLSWLVWVQGMGQSLAMIPHFEFCHHFKFCPFGFDLFEQANDVWATML